jgi:hypothetical protein
MGTWINKTELPIPASCNKLPLSSSTYFSLLFLMMQASFGYLSYFGMVESYPELRVGNTQKGLTVKDRIETRVYSSRDATDLEIDM